MRKLAAAALLPFLLAACSGSDVPTDSPYKGQSAETFSMQLKRGRTIDKQGMLHWFAEYVSGYQAPVATQAPRAVVTMKPSASCRLPRPAEGSDLVQVITWNSKVYSPLYLITAPEFRKITENVMTVVNFNRNPGLALSKAEGRTQQVDVAVTEIAKPVHLVLASQSPVLWNLIADERAKITGVTIISESDTVALANAAPDLPVAVLSGEQAEKCGAAPALMPVRDYPNIKMTLHKANDNDEKYKKKLDKYEAYNRFFKKQFGVASNDVSIGVSVMDHAVVGPVPPSLEARLPFKTLEGAEIRVSPAAFVFFGNETDYIAAKKADVIKTASKLTGGDFKAILEAAGY
jgi:hypothetical protein